MLKELELREGLAGFCGTLNWYSMAPLFPNMTYTDGVKWLADNTDCYWLLDKIASLQDRCQQDEMLKFAQFWTLEVRKDHTAVLTCERDTDDPVFVEHIAYTDFPLDEIKLYCMDGGPDGTHVILLPGEY